MNKCFCQNCRKTFDEDLRIEKSVREPYEFWGEKGTALFYVYTCPYCGSEELEELPLEEDENEQPLHDAGVRADKEA